MLFSIAFSREGRERIATVPGEARCLQAAQGALLCSTGGHERLNGKAGRYCRSGARQREVSRSIRAYPLPPLRLESLADCRLGSAHRACVSLVGTNNALSIPENLGPGRFNHVNVLRLSAFRKIACRKSGFPCLVRAIRLTTVVWSPMLRATYGCFDFGVELVKDPRSIIGTPGLAAALHVPRPWRPRPMDGKAHFTPVVDSIGREFPTPCADLATAQPYPGHDEFPSAEYAINTLGIKNNQKKNISDAVAFCAPVTPASPSYEVSRSSRTGTSHDVHGLGHELRQHLPAARRQCQAMIQAAIVEDRNLRSHGRPVRRCPAKSTTGMSAPPMVHSHRDTQDQGSGKERGNDGRAVIDFPPETTMFPEADRDELDREIQEFLGR